MKFNNKKMTAASKLSNNHTYEANFANLLNARSLCEELSLCRNCFYKRVIEKGEVKYFVYSFK